MSNKQDEQVNENVENLHEINEQEEQKQEGKEQQEEVVEKDPLKEMEAKLNEVNDKYLRLYSEFENFRKRTAKEKLDLIQNGNKNLLEKVIPTLDDFERAIESNKNVDDIKAVKEGFELIYNKFSKTLEAQGVKAMESTGKDFDVEYHEAITRIPAPDKKMKGKVVDTVEKGYTLNGKIIRFAKVVVGK